MSSIIIIIIIIIIIDRGIDEKRILKWILKTTYENVDLIYFLPYGVHWRILDLRVPQGVAFIVQLSDC
jgi:hypothetical protein